MNILFPSPEDISGTTLLAHAISNDATDIHIEPTDDAYQIRYRIDGRMQHVENVLSNNAPILLAKLKLMSQMDTSEHRRPQSGRTEYTDADNCYSIRIETVPTSEGEALVARIITRRDEPLGLDKLFSPAQINQLNTVCSRRWGCTLIMGNTGTGKTTVLYELLRLMPQETQKITTVEDPVEYSLPGVIQVDLQERRGIAYAQAMRALLRSDPDVIAVGEIRDEETAALVNRAAATGHKVFATIHHNNGAKAAAFVERDKWWAQAVEAVIAPRLLRRLCPHCTVPTELTNTQLAKELPWFEPDHPQVHKTFAPSEQSSSCNHCHDGYRGRVMCAGIATRDTDFDITRPLRARAIELLDEGFTSVEELKRSWL